MSSVVANCAVVAVSTVTVLYKSNDVPANASPVAVNVRTAPALSIESTTMFISCTPPVPPTFSPAILILSLML